VGTAGGWRERPDPAPPPHLYVELVWNPEFLREGYAVDDTLRPDRIVIGGASEWAEDRLRQLYAPAIDSGTPVVACDLPTAELVKVSANAFLATKISFINAIAEVCEQAGADVSTLADAIGYDERIGRRFLNAGLGFGGGCLPKDIRALTHRAGELGAFKAVGLMQQVDEINMSQRQRVVELAMTHCPVNILNARVAVLGVAFKPDTDDVRDSPALNVAAALHLRGALVTVYDPEANATARRSFPTLTYAPSLDAAVTDADLVLVLTEWPEIAHADPAAAGRLVAHRTVIDARRCLPTDDWRASGWTCVTLGSAESPLPTGGGARARTAA
jgi:UDPglucose 6-dehydrogenase